MTAASRGLGREIALELAGQGADVVLGVRDPEESAGLVEELSSFGVTARAIRMDVLDLAAAAPPSTRSAPSSARSTSW